MKKNSVLVLFVPILFISFILTYSGINVYKIILKEINKPLILNIEGSLNFSYPLKIWEIRSNFELDENTINSYNCRILDSNGRIFETDVGLENKEYIVIKPRTEYLSWEKYTLSIGGDIRAKNGKKLANKIEYSFDMQEMYFKACNQGNFEGFIPSGVVKDDEDFFCEIKYALDNFYETIELKTANNNISSTSVIMNMIQRNLPLTSFMLVETKEQREIYSDDTGKISLQFKYLDSPEKLRNMRNEVKNKVSEIVSNIIKPEMTDWQKEKAVHDYIINCCKYDTKTTLSMSPAHTEYGCLINGLAVCDGYSKAMYKILNTLGVKCLTISNDTHMWNLVKLGDNYYHVDATWNDRKTLRNEELVSYRYFNLNSEAIKPSHNFDDKLYPICNSNEYSAKALNIVDVEQKRREENAIAVKNSYEFYYCIRNAIVSKKAELIIKVDSYDENEYNVKNAVDRVYNEVLFIPYSIKYRYDDPSSLHKGATEYIEIIFEYY